MGQEPYQKMYTLLFNKITDALEQMEKGNLDCARELLMSGQMEAEEIFIEAVEKQ